MATAEEILRHPLYQKLARIVLDTPANRSVWARNEEAAQNGVKAVVSGASFQGYKDSLDTLVAQIEAARTYYDTNSAGWSHTPKDYGSYHAVFPHQCIEFRRLITSLTPQYRVMEAEIHRMKREARRHRPTPTPRPTPAPAPKKANWWKRIFLATALLGGGWFLGTRNSNNQQSQVKAPPQPVVQQPIVTQQPKTQVVQRPVQQPVTTVRKTLSSAVVVPQGNVYYATTPVASPGVVYRTYSSDNFFAENPDVAIDVFLGDHRPPLLPRPGFGLFHRPGHFHRPFHPGRPHGRRR